MKRTTVFWTQAQIKGLREASTMDGLGVATLVRIFVSDGLARRKRRRAAETK